MRHAVVLGAGIAGTLAAAALVEHTETVTVLERDRTPTVPGYRKGIPQARHIHGLFSSGALAMDSLLPGTLDSLYASGARRLGLPSQILVYSSDGWMNPFPTPHHLICASRSLIDQILRDRLLGQRTIDLRYGIEAVGLLGDRRHVSGVLVRDRRTREEQRIHADLIVDATGHSSKTSHWLTQLGVPPSRTTTVDAGIAYASRLLRAPTTADSQPLIQIQSDPRAGVPGRAGALMLLEDDTWIVSLIGTHGAHPPHDDNGFADFARSLPHPLIADLIAEAEPLSQISGFGHTMNQRYHYARPRHWPTGLLVLGDASTTFNPIYGQGMTVAALSALALRDALRHDIKHTRPIQRAIARLTLIPWITAVINDARYPDAKLASPPPGLHLFQPLVDRLRRAAATEPDACRVFFDFLTIEAPLGRLGRPDVLRAILRRPSNPVAVGAPPVVDPAIRRRNRP
jgi:2-polyprenyl-6-methoxyphenol hydroxylase-like FAD-dependent oxidoreductase